MSVKKSAAYKTVYERPSLEWAPIKCRHCGSAIHPTDINTTANKASCYQCDTIQEIIREDVDISNAASGPLIHIPKGVDVIADSDHLDIRYSHFMSSNKGQLAFLTFFTILWNASIVLAIYQMLQSQMPSHVLFMSLHILVGLGLLTYLSAKYLNYTDVIVREGYIDVNTAPIANPLSNGKSISASAIKQLYVQRRKTGSTNGTSNYTFDLHAILHDRTKVKLLSNSNRDLAKYLEHRIEEYLGISNQAVSGEAQ